MEEIDAVIYQRTNYVVQKQPAMGGYSAWVDRRVSPISSRVAVLNLEEPQRTSVNWAA